MQSNADHRPARLTHAELDSRLLRYFLAVIREGSIRKAADRLNVAASAISRQISDLEIRLGLPLLERLPRGVIPTEAGKAVAAHARQTMEDGEQLLEYLGQLQDLRLGAIRVCCGEGFVGDLLDNGMQPFLAADPETRLHLMLGGTQDIMQAVAEGSADIGLAYDPLPHAGVRSVTISRQPLHMMVAPGNPLSRRKRVSLHDVAREPMALLTASHGIRQLLARVEADQGFHLVPHIEANSIDVIRRAAISGWGVTFLPRFAASAALAANRLAAVPLTDTLLTAANVHLVVRSQRRLPPAVERLAVCLATGMQAFGAPKRDTAERNVTP